MYMLKFVNGTM